MPSHASTWTWLLMLSFGCAVPARVDARPRVTRQGLGKETMTVEEVSARLWGPGRTASFRPAAALERTTLETLVPNLLALSGSGQAPTQTQQTLAERAGFVLETWKVRGETFLALVEAPGKARGAGAYVFRMADADAALDRQRPEVILQAPHAYFDVGTDTLAAELFFGDTGARPPRALFTNTVHRYDGKKKRARADASPADVAHNPDHLFTLVTSLTLQALGEACVVQLHGFAANDRDRASLPAGTAMVVSAGDKAASSSTSAAVAFALSASFEGVRRYPEEVQMLGGTTNAQKAATALVPGASFLHLELSAPVRKALVAEEPRRKAFARAVLGSTLPSAHR